MKKALRFGVPAFLLTGMMAAAFAVSAQQPPVSTPATQEACVADASTVNGCYPPEPGCIRVDLCTWLCP